MQLPLPLIDFLSPDLIFLRLVGAGLAALGVAYFINRLANRLLPGLAEIITDTAASKTKGDKLLQIRRTETMLSVGATVGRFVITGTCLYIAWRLTNPTTLPVAIIGASTFFIVMGAATIGPLLRDMTSGVLMIAERWYNVGDFVVVDPFWELSGVVEHINLRSTQLRSLNGEVVWIHNQHIQAVRVTSRGVRTISIDTFVNDLERGRKLILGVITTLPTGTAMIATALVISEEEQLGNLWRITAVGQTTPGREWLIETFAVQAIVKTDEDSEHPVIVYPPIVRYTDPGAERQFTHSIRGHRVKSKK